MFKETIPVNLSIEEQNVKNSIMRLNEKLNSKLIFLDCEKAEFQSGITLEYFWKNGI